MNRKDWSKKAGVVVLGLAMVLQCSSAFAAERGRGGDRGRSVDRGDRGRSREVVTVGHQRYSYQDGRFFKPGLFWLRFALGVPPLGAVVHFLPSGHKTVVVGGSTYYHSNNTYYRSCPTGYEVVPEPVVTQNVVVAQNYPGERVPINIPNDNGSYTTITLIRQAGGYIGPQGEYYPGNPTIGQLRSLYGR